MVRLAGWRMLQRERCRATTAQFVSRLDKIAAALTAKQSTRQEIVRRITGNEDPEEVLDRMIANGEITENQRGDVRFIRRILIAPVWEIGADGSDRLVGRRKVHTGEIEKVEDWANPSPSRAM